MGRKNYTPEQVTGMLREAEGRQDLSRLGISEQSHHRGAFTAG